MDPIFKFPASPGTPLFPVSPERANRQHLPQSPSLPLNLADPFISHVKEPSDVQGKVAQFNNLSKEATQRRKDNEAALKRAVLGREEAESEARRTKEESSVLRKEIEEGRGRERRVGERLEALMEELQRTKETHAHSQNLYEKEVRRARKEAFKSSSSLVKLQEELKTARNRFTLMREEVEVQRRKVEGREQEAFAAQYQTVGLQEELDRIRQQLKTIEEERNALRTSLKEEEVARIAAEGKIPLPVSREPDEFSSPKKKKQDVLKDNDDPTTMDDSEKVIILRAAYKREARRRKEADDHIHFMKMECQFRCCPCRLAENQGKSYVHDESAAEKMAAIASKFDQMSQGEATTSTQIDIAEKENTIQLPENTPPVATPEQLSNALPSEQIESPSTATTPRFQATSVPATPQSPSAQEEAESLIQFSPTSGTFRAAQISSIPSSPRESSPTHEIPQTPTALLRFSPQFPTTMTIPIPLPEETTPLAPSPPKLRFPTTPRPLPVPPPHTTQVSNVTTTFVPLAVAESPAPFTPSATMTREEALEQIRQRRGRARSIAAGHTTPRKQMIDLGGLRRDISAPAGKV